MTVQALEADEEIQHQDKGRIGGHHLAAPLFSWQYLQDVAGMETVDSAIFVDAMVSGDYTYDVRPSART